MNNKIVIAIFFTLFSQIMVGMDYSKEQQFLFEQKGQLTIGQDQQLSNAFKHSVVHACFYHKDLIPKYITHYRAFLGLGVNMFTNQKKNVLVLRQVNTITGELSGDRSLWSELIINNRKTVLETCAERYLACVPKSTAHNFGMIAIDPANSEKNVFIQFDWNSAEMFLE